MADDLDTTRLYQRVYALERECAAKDAEIAALRERVERAADALERWMCDSSYDSSKGVNVVTAAQRILRGEE